MTFSSSLLPPRFSLQKRGEMGYDCPMSKEKQVMVVCLNPTFQRIMVFSRFWENEVNRCSLHIDAPSGKGVNVVRVLSQLGRKAVVFTHLGGNRTEEFRSLCEKEGIALDWFPAESPIRTCTTVINREKGTATELVEEPLEVDKGASERARTLFASHIDDFDALVITGTRAGGYEENLYPEMVRVAKEKGKLVILDLKGKDLASSLPFRPDIVKPNLSELIATMEGGRVISENEDSDSLKPKVRRMARDLHSAYGTKVVISRGKYPTWVFDGEREREIPSRPVKVVNTVGCGDALTAGLVDSLLSGRTLEEAVAFAVECAGKNAEKMGYGIL